MKLGRGPVLRCRASSGVSGAMDAKSGVDSWSSSGLCIINGRPLSLQLVGRGRAARRLAHHRFRLHTVVMKGEGAAAAISPIWQGLATGPRPGKGMDQTFCHLVGK